MRVEVGKYSIDSFSEFMQFSKLITDALSSIPMPEGFCITLRTTPECNRDIVEGLKSFNPNYNFDVATGINLNGLWFHFDVNN